MVSSVLRGSATPHRRETLCVTWRAVVPHCGGPMDRWMGHRASREEEKGQCKRCICWLMPRGLLATLTENGPLNVEGAGLTLRNTCSFEATIRRW
jgi:hypothetical protein